MVSSRLGYVAHYLGETGVGMAKRLRSHEAAYWSGEYGLRDWVAFNEGRDKQLKPSHYRRYTSELRAKFNADRDSWAPVISAELAHHQIWLLPLPFWPGSEFRQLRMRLEQSIGEWIRLNYHPDLPNLFEGYDEYRTRTQSDPHVFRFEGFAPLVNFPQQLGF